jgi:hypothetical protein
VSHELEDLERPVRTARATPRAEFLRDLERSLPARRVARDRRCVRVAIAGLGLASALAAVAFALSATGPLPFRVRYRAEQVPRLVRCCR